MKWPASILLGYSSSNITTDFGGSLTSRWLPSSFAPAKAAG